MTGDLDGRRAIMDEAAGRETTVRNSAQPESYTGIAKFFHWAMAVIWIAAWCMGMIAVYLRDAFNPHHGMTIAHKAVGSTILFLVVLRIAWRLTHPAPERPDLMSPLARKVAGMAHIALYAVALIALPLSGWLWSSVADKPIMLLWLYQLPPLTAPNPAAYETAKLVHLLCAWSMGALVAGHILAALKHHFIDRDGILAGMLPGSASRGPAASFRMDID